MSEEKTVVVKFLKHYTPYVEGDVAGIPESEVAKLVKAEIAVEVGVTKSDEIKYFKHTLTQADFELNPELAEKGLNTGDIIEIPEPTDAMKFNDLKAIADQYRINTDGMKSKKELIEAIKKYEDR